MGRFFLFVVVIITSMSACLDLNMQNTFADLAPGKWRAVFTLEAEKVPVQFSVDKIGESTYFTFVNGTQDTRSQELQFWGDTLTIPFEKGAYLKVIFEVDKMEGYLYDPTNSFYPISFVAQQGQLNRFPDVRKEPVMDMSGEWNISLIEADTTESSILSIRADKNNLDCQMIHNMDTMSMCGVIQQDIIVVSGFDGKQVHYMKGQIVDGTLQKAFYITNNKKYTVTGLKKTN